MILPIALYPHPFLRRRMQPVEKITDEIQALAENMIETMRNAPGVGLAAPQVLADARLFVIQPDTEDPSTTQVFINPEIIAREGKMELYEEGCLSIPGVLAKVRRPWVIRVRFQDLKGQWQEARFEGFPARVIQHEFDHLDGVLFLDRLPQLRRRLLRKDLQAVEEGKIRPGYPFVHPRLRPQPQTIG